MDDIFNRLNKFSHTVYYNDGGGHYIVWKNAKREKKLYTVKKKENRFEIYDPNQIMLADGLTENRVISFIEADMNIGSPLPNSEIISIGKNDPIDQVMVDAARCSAERDIMKAAKRHGDVGAGMSLLKELAARQKINKKTSGTVKRKRKIDFDDLDLDE
jgi:hypothetical protein